MRKYVVAFFVGLGCIGGAVVGAGAGALVGNIYRYHALLDRLPLRLGSIGGPVDEIALGFRMAADAYQPKLPQHLDAMTTLTAVNAEGRHITFRYSLDLAQSKTPGDALMATLHDRSKAFWCRPGSRSTIDKGGVVRFEYVDSTGGAVGHFQIEACE